MDMQVKEVLNKRVSLCYNNNPKRLYSLLFVRIIV